MLTERPVYTKNLYTKRQKLEAKLARITEELEKTNKNNSMYGQRHSKEARKNISNGILKGRSKEWTKQRQTDYMRLWVQKNYAKKMLSTVKHGAKARGLMFDLVLEDIHIPETCPVLGIPIQIVTGKGRTPNLPSVDRIDPSKGYIKDNIIIVSWRANQIKTDATIPELQKVVDFYKRFPNK